MQPLEGVRNIFHTTFRGIRSLMMVWFGGIMLFGVLMTIFVSSGAIFGDSAETIEARERMQERTIQAEIEEDQRKANMDRQRSMGEDGWGSEAAANPSVALPEAETASARRRNAREAKEAREAGWGT